MDFVLDFVLELFLEKCAGTPKYITTRDPKKLLLKYTINQASTVDYQVHAIVLYEEEVVVDKVGDKLLIV